jgi:hypothetical protein
MRIVSGTAFGTLGWTAEIIAKSLKKSCGVAGVSHVPRAFGAKSCCKQTASQNARIAQGLDAANGREIGIDPGF